MTKTRKLHMFIAAAPLLLAGCSGTKDMNAAEQAVQSGDFVRAFDRYCQAARRKPGSRSARIGLTKTREPAAAALYGRAVVAKKSNRYDDAWKYAMQTLVVQPDHAHALRMIRDLEGNHSDNTIALRRRWLRGDPRVLAVSDRSQDATLALADHSQDAELADASAEADADADPPAPEPHMGTNGEPHAAEANSEQPIREMPSAIRTPEPPPGYVPAKRDATPMETAAAAKTENKYLLVTMLSRNDGRFPERIDTVDGIAVRLRKVTDDEEAELDVYINDDRYKRRQQLKVGEHLIVPGKSGKSYALDILLVRPTRQIVRFGLRSATPRTGRDQQD